MKYRTIIGEPEIEQEQVKLGKRTWPEFMQHDSIIDNSWSDLYNHFLDFQFAQFYENEIAGVGNSKPQIVYCASEK